jgi:hypothetical protein
MSTTRLDGPGTSSAMSEQVDPFAGRVLVRGRLTRQGLDLLRGTVESLFGQGHARVLVDLEGVHTVDDGMLDGLRALRRSEVAAGHSVVLMNAP